MSTENRNTAVEELLTFIKNHKQSDSVRLLTTESESDSAWLIARCVHKLLRRQFLYRHEKPAMIKQSSPLHTFLTQALVLWPQLGELFCITEGQFNWRPHVAEETKLRLRKFAYEYYQPRMIT